MKLSIAQRESVPFTRERSKVRSLVRPPEAPTKSRISMRVVQGEHVAIGTLEQNEA
jgi:hypothetical protein